MVATMPDWFWTLIAATLVGVAVHKTHPRMTWQRSLILAIVVGAAAIFILYLVRAMEGIFTYAIVITLRSALAGFVTAIALRLIYPTLKERQLMTIVCGWAAGALMTFYTWNYLGVFNHLEAWAVYGFIGGGATSWGLRSANPAFSWKYIWIVNVGWVLAMTAYAWLTMNFRPFDEGFLGIIISVSIHAAIVVAIGGGATLFAMKRAPYAPVE